MGAAVEHRRIGPRELAGKLGDWHDGTAPLAAALASRIGGLIAHAALPPGTTLPAQRRLASQLGVSRGTVVAAFDRLGAAGLIATRHGSGSVVTAAGSPVSGPREAHVTTTLKDESIVRALLPDDPAGIDLRAADWHGTDDLPAEAFELDPVACWPDGGGHGYELLGLPRLRSAIAAHLSRTGLPTTPDQVLVTSGAQQAIALTAQLVVGPRDTIAVEALTYPGAMDVAAAQQARLVAAPFGASGLELAGLQRVVERHRPRLAYLTPGLHNPTGRTLPGAAVARLAEMAASWSTTIIDDRTLADTRLDGVSPPLAAYVEDAATARRIVTVGSLSKSMWGGLRVGWLRATPSLIERLARLRSVTDLGSPVHPQLIAASLLERAEAILPARRTRLRRRLDLLETELRAALPGWRWRRPEGGLCLWVDLGAVDAARFCAVAARHGVGVLPGSAFAPGGGPSTSLRLPFGHPPEVLREAVSRLAAAWTQTLDTGGATVRVDVPV